MIHYQDLYRRILIEPHERTADEIKIVSGYATSAMAEKHLAESAGLKLSIIVGMCSRDGLSITNHRGFQNLKSQHGTDFECRYNAGTAIHSKLYVWYSNGVPCEAYIGSANYTQQAFVLNYQNEILAPCDPVEADRYFNLILPSSINCTAPNANQLIPIFNSVSRQNVPGRRILTPMPMLGTQPSVELPLVDRRGNVPVRSGLNWGQRPGRDQNQAYISIPQAVARTHFFPPRTVRFNVLTDDGQMMTMAVAQGGDKALHTPENNAIIGRYLRHRLGLQDGAFVSRHDLDNYGRTSVTFIKFDDENYFMVF